MNALALWLRLYTVPEPPDPDPFVSGLCVCDGNSLTSGTGATAGNEYPTVLAASLPSGWTVENFGEVGQTTTQRENAAGDIIELFDAERTENVAVLWEITNALFLADGALSANDAYAEYVSWCETIRASGFSVVAVTVLPRTEAGTYAGFEADRQTVNGLIRANFEDFADALADVADHADLDDSEDTNFYNADGVHLNDAGYAIVAAVVESAVLGTGELLLEDGSGALLLEDDSGALLLEG
jgi:lysophospholipase L1-like esterase